VSELWRARTPCPQCGGEVELDVGDPVLFCPFCRTGLYLASDGPLCYRLSPAPGSETNGPLIYLPYWRFRGLRYRVLADPPEVQGGLLDATVPASDLLPAAANLGVRPQVAPLTLELGEGGAAPPDRTADAAMRAAEGAVEALHGGRAAFTQLIGEAVCLILAPYHLEQRSGEWQLREALLDGATYPVAEALAVGLRGETPAPGPGAPRPGGKVSFVPLRCPECGHDLPAEPGSVALLCGHCTRAWWVRGRRLASLPYSAPRAQASGARYFPFWELAFRAEGLPARNRAELRRWVVSYQPVPEGWERQPCVLLLPGFKLQPRTFLRLARAFSLAPLQIPDAPLPLGEPFAAEAVRLPLEEAAQALQVLLADLVAGNPREFPRVPGLQLRVKRARLLYLPFHRQRDEWVEETTGVALQATAVAHGTRL